jgi:hypothetical protein
VLLFFVIVAGLGAGFAILGREPEQAPRPRWKVGETVDVDVTLVKEDRQDLACSSADAVAGKHCGFEAANKPWSKGASADATLLRPYATVDHANFAAAGMWDNPTLAADKIPSARFVMKCKFKVEGMIKLAVRWHENEPWSGQNEWPAGSVSDCKLGP